MTFTAPAIAPATDTPSPEQFQADLLTAARTRDLQKLTTLLDRLDRSSTAVWVESIAGILLYAPSDQIRWLVCALTPHNYGWPLLTRATALITGGMVA